MRVQQNVRGGSSKYGLTEIMKLVIAVVFSLTIALLNITEKPNVKPLEVHISSTVSAASVPKPAEPAVVIKAFDVNDPTTWPKCADDEIVRADTGKCAAKQAQTAPAATQPQKANNEPIGDVEGIVRAAAIKYGIDPDHFVAVAKCESGLNPGSINYNYYENGNPSGLFQHISGYWPKRAANYGWTGASVFNAQANAEVTAQMFRDGLQYLWQCK